jgi:hypothetical protein
MHKFVFQKVKIKELITLWQNKLKKHSRILNYSRKFPELPCKGFFRLKASEVSIMACCKNYDWSYSIQMLISIVYRKVIEVTKLFGYALNSQKLDFKYNKITEKIADIIITLFKEVKNGIIIAGPSKSTPDTTQQIDNNVAFVLLML